MKTKKILQNRGIGLVEIMVAVVVLGIIAAAAAPSFTDMLNRRRVQAVATSISTDLAFLRTEQSVHASEIDLQVNPDPSSKQISCYSMYVKSNLNICDCTKPTNVCTNPNLLIRVERVPASTGISYASFVGGAVNNVFKYDSVRLSPNPAGLYFDVCGSTRSSPRPILRIEFNDIGRTKICSPNSSMSGYGNCAAPVAEPQCL